jgi:iron complex transport system substrate-binding protein
MRFSLTRNGSRCCSLICCWLELLRASGYRVESIRTRSLDDVARALEIVGSLTGHASEADAAAAAFRKSLAELASRHRESPPIRVFYQVSRQPLYTVNGEHFVSELLALCGGANIFSDLTELAPLVSPEAVLDRDPEVILAAGDVDHSVFDEWKRWTELKATRYDNFFLLPAAEIGRPATRLVQAGHAACAALDSARQRRAGVTGG